MVRIKICGLTNLEDALAAIEAGAHALGFVFAPSLRRVTPEQVKEIVENLPPLVCTVGVFMDQPLAEVRETLAFCHLDVAQFHGEESPDYCAAFMPRAIKVFTPRSLPQNCHSEGAPRPKNPSPPCIADPEPPASPRQTLRFAQGDMRTEAFEARPGLKDYPVAAYMLDREKSGPRSSPEELWPRVRELERYGRPVILAGGLTAENVARAIEAARPYAVDVTSGVESQPGKKDPAKLRAFVAAAREGERLVATR